MKNYNRCANRNIVMMIVLYCFILLWVLLFKFANLDEIKTIYGNVCGMTLKERFLFDIRPFQFTGNIPMQKLEVVLNAIIFAPLGVMLCLKDGRVRLVKHLTICFMFSLLIEVIQLFTCIGGFAIDDLLMNTLGYLLAIPFYLFIFKKLDSKFLYYFYKCCNCILIVISIWSLISIISITPELYRMVRQLYII